MIETKDEQGYQGWTNYETWVTKLWMDNDQGTHEFFRDLTTYHIYHFLKEREPYSPIESELRNGNWIRFSKRSKPRFY